MKKFLFYLSILPIFMLLIVAFINMFYGFDGLCIFGGCPSVYGTKAFYETIIIYGTIFSTMIPIYPICLLYIIYYIWQKNKKSQKKENMQEQNDSIEHKENINAKATSIDIREHATQEKLNFPQPTKTKWTQL